MVFSSLTFLYFFLPVVLGLYFIVPMKIKNLIILISGILFYSWGEPIYVGVMLLSTVIDYTAGLIIHKYDDKPKIRFACLLVSLCMNLGLLGVFKYSSFLIGNINSIFGLSIADPKLPLPIGISFFTFQSMSYTIDLYLRKIKVQKNIISFTSFVSLFPQIVAGPIVRYDDIATEIDNRTITVSKVSEGIGVFVKGLAKKVILANNIGIVWTTVKAMEYSQISALTAWVGILAFTFQIYFDFSGYSDMAVGLGKMMGFSFPQNFDYPYVSKSVSEFWRRWHMTLGAWFRSYVYIPLGGNRNGLPKTIRNLIIVWFLTGMWHGASWNFIIWGIYFGVLIIIERLGFGKILEKLPTILSRLYTFLIVVFGWVLFEITNLSDIKAYFNAMFASGGLFADSTGLYLLSTNIILFAVCIFGSTTVTKKIYTKLNEQNGKIIQVAAPVVQLVFMLLSTAYLVNSTSNVFLYFNF